MIKCLYPLSLTGGAPTLLRLPAYAKIGFGFLFSQLD